jgi:hypothetical protein
MIRVCSSSLMLLLQAQTMDVLYIRPLTPFKALGNGHLSGVNFMHPLQLDGTTIYTNHIDQHKPNINS